MSLQVEIEGLPIEEALQVLQAKNALSRLWARDASLWSTDAEAVASIETRLGWLGAPELFLARAAEIEAQAARLLEGVERVVLLGMGGSSLCPEVLAQTLGPTKEGRPLTVLDSTDPDVITALEASLDLARTRFIVASKSGGTIETLSLYRAFEAVTGRGEAFVAITDPGSSLAAIADEKAFAACLTNPEDVGGRFSALTYFGLLPAALLGLDLPVLLGHAMEQTKADGAGVDPAKSPAARLAAAMVVGAQAGRDKLTLRATPTLESLGGWIEQLIAESTGKQGRGIVPIDREPSGVALGDDRLFLTLAIEGEAIPTTPRGAPTVRVILPGPLAIGGVFFLFEMATALAGVLLELNPFDEPDVKEAKRRTGALLAHFEAEGALPRSRPLLAEGKLSLFADPALELAPDASLGAGVAAHLGRARPGDYLAVQAFLPATEAIEGALQRLRVRAGARAGLATTLGFGPRFLHSSGQLHKGGANTGLFLQLTHRPATSREIPGAPYAFETLLLAQAAGDFEALVDGGRRVLRIDLGDADLLQAIDAILPTP